MPPMANSPLSKIAEIYHFEAAKTIQQAELAFQVVSSL